MTTQQKPQSKGLGAVPPPDLDKRSVLERTAAICQKHNISFYRLAQIFRTDEGSLKQKTPGSRPLKWLLSIAEVWGLDMFLAAESAWGVYVFQRYNDRKPRRGTRDGQGGESMPGAENEAPGAPNEVLGQINGLQVTGQPGTNLDTVQISKAEA